MNEDGQPGVIASGHPDYDSLRATFNAMLDRRPAEILVCSSVSDVVAAVRRARQTGLPISIRGGGHGVAGHCAGDGSLVVDLRGMRQVAVDAQRRVAVAAGGATWEEYDAATQRFGLASTGGTFVDTGVAGLTLGGGIGYLQGTHGFAVDTLAGVTMVTADGDVVQASSDGNPELFWGIRGAGANLGVVTGFEFSLRPLGALYGGEIDFPLSSGAEVLRIVRDLAAAAPDELAFQVVLGRRTAVSTVLVCFQGSESDAVELLAPLRRLRPVENDALRVLSYAEMQATNPLLPFGLRHYWKGHFLRDLPDDVVDATADHVARRPEGGFATVLIEFIGGAPLRVPADSMAFNQRSARVNASALGIWMDAALDSEHVAWARTFATLIAPVATEAEYVNYMTDDTPVDRVRATYGDAKYARLRDLKKRYDPENVFRFNANIAPAA